MAWCDVVEPRTLRECRLALGKSQAACAALLGVSPESYRTWDAGRRARRLRRADSRASLRTRIEPGAIGHAGGRGAEGRRLRLIETANAHRARLGTMYVFSISTSFAQLSLEAWSFPAMPGPN